MNSLLLHVFSAAQGAFGGWGWGDSGLEKKLRAPQRNLCSPGMLSRSLTQQSKAGWSGDWVQPHHLDGNVISKEVFSADMVGVRWGTAFWGSTHWVLCRSSEQPCVFCLWWFIFLCEQGGKGSPGLPGLPGPAGYTGQKGDRVRSFQAKSRVFNHPRAMCTPVQITKCPLALLKHLTMVLGTVCCCPKKQ